MNGAAPPGGAFLPDLLEPEPRARVDLKKLERAADFAFAAAGTYTEIDDCLDHADAGATLWDPTGFEKPLFLKDLVEQGFAIVIDGGVRVPSRKLLGALLSRPPVDPGVTRFRQEILRELAATPALRRAVEQTYVRVLRLRELLGPKDTMEIPAPTRRRMEILAVVRAVFRGLAADFQGASSGLRRLGEAGEAALGSPGFERLAALLDLEQNLATVEARLRVGGDGELRSVEIVAVRENQGNWFYEPPLARLRRRVERVLRGFFFRDDDVRDAVVDAVFAGVKAQVAVLFQLAGDLEFYLACLGFRDRARARGLEVCLPELVEAQPDQRRRFERLFNPHLLGEPRAPVPCTLEFEQPGGIAVFTGLNSGGKTRLLQAVAIAQMLGQAGAFVPASEARLVWARGLFLSLIEEARHDQREGRLGSELLRIREVFERLTPGGLVLLDELCSGTNPSEGQEIFELVTELLSGLSPQAFITTHFLDFAARLAASGDRGMVFLQVGLDEHDEPTFQFVPGVARSSLARKTAARLGVTREALEALVARARQKSGPGER